MNSNTDLDTKTDSGIPYVDTTGTHVETAQTPQEEGELSAVGHMSHPESDDTVDQLDEPFEEGGIKDDESNAEDDSTQKPA